MASRPRDRRRLGWPSGLYEPRPGYFVWRHPKTGKTFALGYVPLATARAEAMAANAHVLSEAPSLLDRVSGKVHTIGELLDKMPTPENQNTARTWRSQDKRIREKLGSKPCAGLTVADCASFLEEVIAEGKDRLAQALRSRLIAICKRGMGLGWMESNPAEVTEEIGAEVKRGRLTLEQFRAIHSVAGQVAEWLPRAMMLGIVTGQDVSTIAKMERSHVADGFLIVQRSKTKKTNQPVAIPLGLRLEVLGVSLADLVTHKTGVISKYLVHHVQPYGNAPVGANVHKDSISRRFTDARKLAGIPDEAAPTFHEIRSLCKRLYTAQGNVDTKALLGHKTDRIADLYADPRGVEPIRVSIG